MADYTATIPPKVKALVAKSLTNQTGISGLVNPQSPSSVARSEFFQLRNACSQNITEDIAQIVGFSKEEIGQMCSEVLFVAADRMRRQEVPINDPTHLLAPYHLGQIRRGYSELDGTPERNAVLGAQIAATLNMRKIIVSGIDIATSDDMYPINMRGNVLPHLLPKKASADTPLEINSSKGIARDSAFTYATAVAILNENKLRAREASGLAAPDLVQKKDDTACTVTRENITRPLCVTVGYSLSNKYLAARY